MKKNGSMQGTLNKLFGKKSANNSLYANNPPWILPQGSKKAPADYADEVHNSFAFLDDSGTATLKSRPGPRVRPTLNFSNGNTDAQGLAVPTPSVPMGFTDNAYMGNGSKINGNYRMYSSVGDLRLHNYYDDDDSGEIPAPPSMPPPPPPTMAPQQSPPSSTISSPSSPSPPDFIPPNPNSSAPMPPSLLPTDHSAVLTAEQAQLNVPKWKSETGLHAASKDLTMTLPNRFSLNPAAFQHNQGQMNFDAEPRSTLPKAFKIPPPAPTRTSSIQMQEPQNIGYAKDPPQSAVRSSFNPSVQAKLYTSNQGQKPLNDTLNKRKSMLIMEDLPDFPENSDQRVEKSAKTTDTIGTRAAYTLKDNANVLHNRHVELNKEMDNEDAINANRMEHASIKEHNQQPYKFNNTQRELKSVVPEKAEAEHRSSQNGAERNILTLNRHGYTKEMHSTLKPSIKCVSLRPIIDDLSLSNSSGSKHELPRKEIGILPQEFTRIDKDVKVKPERSLENIKDCPPTPPPMTPPPPPPKIVVSNQQSIAPLPQPVQNITPPKTSPILNSTTPPPAPPPMTAPVARMPSPLLSPKPKTFSVTPKSSSFVPPPPPPKAPPAPPPLPSSFGPSSSVPVPLLEALQAKQQTLRKVPKSIEVRAAQTNSVSSVDDDQKFKVDKIKGELEALFSPKKDDKGDRLRNSRMGLEANKNSNGNFSQTKGGENNLVNSLMLKVPILPAKFEKEDVDVDNSEWLPKSNNIDIQIPEPDYVPASPIRSTEKPVYLEAHSKIPKANLEILVPSTPVVPAQQSTNRAEELMSSIPTYKPHHETKVPTETSTLDELPVVISKPEMNERINLGSVPQHTQIVTLGPSVMQEPPSVQAESTTKHPVTGEQVEVNSPMALLMAAQKRAQKAKSLDRGNLPKISVTNGLILTSPTSPYNERRANTFSVVPNKETVGQFTDEVTSFPSNSNSDFVSVPSTWRDGEVQSSNTSSTMSKNSDHSSAPSLYSSSEVLASTTNFHENNLKSTTYDNHSFNTVPTEYSPFNISSFPSPILDQKLDNEMEYGIIPPPAEFMNSPIVSNRNSLGLEQEDQSYSFDHGTSSQSNFNLHYDKNNSVIHPYTSLSSSNHGFNSYLSDNYSTTLNTDTQRGSLIKRRLYMNEPESSRSYGQNTSYLRSSTMPMSYSNMHGQSSSNMVPDPRRSSTTSRFLPQGRREYSENMNRMVPPMTDLKYKSQNSDYSAGKSSTRAQSTYPQGMTFTVRPGTRQPISQMYQGGYL